MGFLEGDSGMKRDLLIYLQGFLRDSPLRTLARQDCTQGKADVEHNCNWDLADPISSGAEMTLQRGWSWWGWSREWGEERVILGHEVPVANSNSQVWMKLWVSSMGCSQQQGHSCVIPDIFHPRSYPDSFYYRKL